MNDLLLQWYQTAHAQLMDPDRIPIILMAMLVCAIIGMISGPLAGNANPFLWALLDKMFGNLGDRLDRSNRVKADLMFRGFLLSVFVMVIAMLIGKAFDSIQGNEMIFEAVRVLMLSLLLSVGSIWFSLLKLYFAMEHNKVGEGAYFAIARSTQVNLSAGDNFGITRTAMGLSARSFDKALVSPAFWFLIGGFPVACMYAGLAMLSWRFGKNGLGSGFASVPLALERLMGFVPSVFSAFLITMATFITPTSSIAKGVAAWLGHKNRAPYEQGGFPLSALAWALNVSLGGAVQDLSCKALKGEWVGPEGATAQLDHKHLRRAIYINVIATLLFVVTLLGAYMYSDFWPVGS
ncbi:MAG: cobalamin biosynthesis protein [Pseudomonadota bacterium]